MPLKRSTRRTPVAAPAEPPISLTSPWGWFALVATAICVVISASYVLYDTDLWQHLAMGRAIWTTPGALHVNLWTWPDYGQPYFVSSWGFRALVWPLWKLGSVAGLFAWRWITTLAVWALLLATARSMGARGFSALLVMVWWSLGYRLRTDVRPETLASVLFALELWLLERNRRRTSAGEKPDRSTWWIVAIACAWANVHISFSLGFALLGFYLAGAHLAAARGSAAARASVRTLWLIGVAAVGASFINPYGWTTLRQPLEFALHWRNDPLMKTIAELQPLTASEALRRGLAIWPALWAWRLMRGRFDLVEGLGCAVFTALAILSSRFLATYFVIAAPFVARDVHEILVWRGFTGLPVPGRAIACVVFGVALGLPEWLRADLPLGLRIDPLVAPEAACEFMATHGVRGRGFVHSHFGGYLAWRFSSSRDRLPFLSTQPEYSPPADRAGYLAALQSAEGWRALDAARRFDYVLLERAQVGPDSLLDALDREPGWRMVFSDDAAELLVREGGALRAVADSFGFRIVPAGQTFRSLLVQASERDSAVRRAAEVELDRMIASSPHHGAASHLRGWLAYQEGDLDAARRHLREALSLLPGLSGVHDMLGTIAYRQGDPREALAQYERERREHAATSPGLYFRMGASAQRLGDLNRAREYYRRELALDPNHQSARDSLAALDALR